MQPFTSTGSLIHILPRSLEAINIPEFGINNPMVIDALYVVVTCLWKHFCAALSLLFNYPQIWFCSLIWALHYSFVLAKSKNIATLRKQLEGFLIAEFLVFYYQACVDSLTVKPRSFESHIWVQPPVRASQNMGLWAYNDRWVDCSLSWHPFGGYTL